VNLDPIEAAASSATRCFDKLAANLAQSRPVQLQWDLPPRSERFRRWTDGLPATFFSRHSVALPQLPGRSSGSFAAGMIELNTDWNIREAARIRDEPRQRGFIFIGIKPEASRRDSPHRADSRGLHNHEPSPGNREVADVHPMPWLRGSVDCAVLAQG